MWIVAAFHLIIFGIENINRTQSVNLTSIKRSKDVYVNLHSVSRGYNRIKNPMSKRLKWFLNVSVAATKLSIISWWIVSREQLGIWELKCSRLVYFKAISFDYKQLLETLPHFFPVIIPIVNKLSAWFTFLTALSIKHTPIKLSHSFFFFFSGLILSYH